MKRRSRPFGTAAASSSPPNNRLTPQIHVSEIVDESVAGIMQRPWRAALTAFGTVLGIGSFVAILGLTTSANSQISNTFNKLSATEVNVKQAAGSDRPEEQTILFPSDSEALVWRIHGVKASGLRIRFKTSAQVSRFGPGDTDVLSRSIQLEGASPGLWSAIGVALSEGRLFDSYLATQRVAVLGADVAKDLGITTVKNQPTIYIDKLPFTLIGLIDRTQSAPGITGSVIVPVDVASRYFGAPDSPPTMVIRTKLGAAPVVAEQVSIALDPVHPERFSAVGPKTPTKLASQVSSSLSSLFFALAAVSLLVGAVGIANTTLVSVLERVPEIGLRRALGAMPRHVGAQFLLESTTLGAFGGLVGTLLGTGVVLLVAAFQNWTAVIEPWTAVFAPMLGALVGLIAGLYPSLRASRVEPIEAFRR